MAPRVQKTKILGKIMNLYMRFLEFWSSAAEEAAFKFTRARLGGRGASIILGCAHRVVECWNLFH